MNKADKAHIKEALISAYNELTELSRAKEWFVPDSIDLLVSALEILTHEQEE